MAEISNTLIWVTVIVIIICLITLLSIIFLLARKKDTHIDREENLSKELNELESIKIENKANKKIKIKHDDNDIMTAQDYDMKQLRKKGNINYLKEWYKRKYKRNDIVCINMKTDTGNRRYLFTPLNIDGTFIWRKKKYIVDKNKIYYVENLDMYGYDYDESLTIPIKWELDKGSLKKATDPQIQLLLNPDVLFTYSESKFGKDVMAGGGFTEIIRSLKMFIIITMVAAICTLLYLLIKTGAFNQIQSLV